MTDYELAVYLGIVDDPRWPHAIEKLVPHKRATYERMREIEDRLNLWQGGVGPKPDGVIVCKPHK